MKKYLLIAILLMSLQANAEKVAMALSRNPWCGLDYVAMVNGYFKEEGLDIDAQYLQSGRHALDSVLAGSAQVCFVGDAPIAYLGYTGEKNILVLDVVSIAYSNAIVARRSAGIAKPADLKGKRVAYSPGTTSAVFVYRFLKKHGIKPSEVQLTGVQPMAIPTSVIAKGVDAASSWDYYISKAAKQLGNDAIVFRDKDLYAAYAMNVADHSWAMAHPQTVMALHRALVKAAEFTAKHPQQAREIVGRECAMDAESMEDNWPLFDFTLREPGTALNQVAQDGEWIHNELESYQNKPVPDYSIYFERK